MRLPWVSRELANMIERRRVDTADHLRECQEAVLGWSSRYFDLEAKYHALKLQGAVAVEPQTPIARKEVDLVVQRINILSAGKPGLRAAMLNQLSDDRLLRGLGDIEILQRIEAGVTTDDGVMA